MSPLSEHERTLSIESPVIPEHQGRPALVAVKLDGREGVNELFSYEVTLKTPDERNFSYSSASDFELDGWIGREATVRIELEGSGTYEPGASGGAGQGNRGSGQREISGLITEARLLRTEGRHVFYQITLKPWLHLATLTSDCKIFQDLTVVELLDTLLQDYPFPVEKRLT